MAAEGGFPAFTAGKVSGSIPLISTIKKDTFLKRKQLGMKILSCFRYFIPIFIKNVFCRFSVRVEYVCNGDQKACETG